MKTLSQQILDRNSEVPLHDQIRNLIEEAIHNGDLREGENLPNERVLQDLYSVSRSTIRRALQTLENCGYIKRIQGSGTEIINSSPLKTPKSITSFTQDIINRGQTPSSKTLSVSAVLPSPTICDVFNISDTEAVWCVRRLRLADDIPIAFNDLFIPPKLEFCADELFNLRSYYELLEKKFALTPQNAFDKLGVCQAKSEEVKLLKVEHGDTLIKLNRTTFSEDGQPLEYTDICFDPKYFEYRVFLNL